LPLFFIDGITNRLIPSKKSKDLTKKIQDFAIVFLSMELPTNLIPQRVLEI
jgi:hypothetical protein